MSKSSLLWSTATDWKSSLRRDGVPPMHWHNSLGEQNLYAEIQQPKQQKWFPLRNFECISYVFGASLILCTVNHCCYEWESFPRCGSRIGFSVNKVGLLPAICLVCVEVPCHSCSYLTVVLFSRLWGEFPFNISIIPHSALHSRYVQESLQCLSF